MTISPTNTSMYLDMLGSIDTFPTKESLHRTIEPISTEVEKFSYPKNLGNYYSDEERISALEDMMNEIILGGM